MKLQLIKAVDVGLMKNELQVLKLVEVALSKKVCTFIKHDFSLRKCSFQGSRVYM